MTAAAPAGIAVSRGALTVSADGAAAATPPTQAATASATTTTATTTAGSTTSTTPTGTAAAGSARAGGTVQAGGQTGGGQAASGSHEVGWGEWAWGGLASAARKADQVGGRALGYALTLGGDAGDSASLVDIVYTGDMGVIQGAANAVNGVQDAAIGTGNLIGKGVNALAGYTAVEERASPDWSRGLVVAESDTTHAVSKFLGGNGVITLATAGLGSATSAGTTGVQAVKIIVQADGTLAAAATTTVAIPATAAGVAGATVGIVGQAVQMKEVEISKTKYPETSQHIEDAQASGHPSELTIDRAGAEANRAESLKGITKVPGKQLDEYPPAMFEEGGAGASVRPINPSDNLGAGASMGNQLRGVPNGTKVRIKVIP